MDEKFGERLKLLRTQKGLSQEELAFELGSSRTTISRWESGTCFPDICTLNLICSYFDCSADYLLYGTSDLYGRNSEGGSKEKGSAADASDSARARRLLPWVLLLLLIGAMIAMYVCSRNIPSEQWITREEAFEELETGETWTETVTYAIEAANFIPFLRTYHLGIVFVTLCILTGIDIVYLLKREGFAEWKHRKKSEKNTE